MPETAGKGVMKYIFGPVPSRRLGQSLGVDTIPPKTCNWNCIYCQLGRTKPLKIERKPYYPPEEILAEVDKALEAHQPGEIDWVTFVGSGEPTLHADMGHLIHGVKQMTSLPVAVITNGSLLYRPEVRQELLLADAVLPSLDAGSPGLYRQINRPHPVCTYDRLLSGLCDFSQEYNGKLWVEVMLLQGLNDTPQALHDLSQALHLIQPDAIHINLPTRPPAETWVHPPDEASLVEALSVLGSVAETVHPAGGSFDLGGYDNPIDAVLGIITRHPMRQEELVRTLDRWSPGEVNQVLAELVASGRAQVIERNGVIFWSASTADYPDQAHSERTKPKVRASSKKEAGQ